MQVEPAVSEPAALEVGVDGGLVDVDDPVGVRSATSKARYGSYEAHDSKEGTHGTLHSPRRTYLEHEARLDVAGVTDDVELATGHVRSVADIQMELLAARDEGE